jgi:hypothetical protein
MPYDEMTLRAILAAYEAEKLGFSGTADAFFELARIGQEEMLKPERRLYLPATPINFEDGSGRKDLNGV